MANLQILQVLAAISTGGLIFLTIGYFAAQFFQGGRNRNKDDIETENSLNTYLKNQVAGFKEIVEIQNKKIVELGEKIAELSGAMNEKDKTIAKYLEILQNRNPELLTVLKEIKDFMGQLHTAVKTIDERSEQRERRDSAVDQGHVAASAIK